MKTTTTTPTIRERVVSRAKQLGYEPRELINATGLNRDTVKRFLAGTQDLTSEKLDVLLQFLEIELVEKEKIISQNSIKTD